MCYIDVPGNMVTDTVAVDKIRLAQLWYVFNFLIVTDRFYPRCPDPPLMLADPLAVSNAAKVLRNAERPLVIIGKG